MYRILRASQRHYQTIERLRKELFGDTDKRPLPEREWWIAWKRDVAVGFAGMKQMDSGEPFGFLSLCGVLAAHRGHGLQKRLIRVRLRRIRQLGLKGAITYTIATNHPSSNSLIRMGFKLYSPRHAFVGDKEVLYWRHDF